MRGRRTGDAWPGSEKEKDSEGYLMSIRSRLLLIYGVMIASLLLVGFFCIRAILEWRQAATELSEIHEQSLRAERLRAEAHREIYYALDYLSGQENAREEFERIQQKAPDILDTLRSSSLTTEEYDHIVGLEETHFELVWIVHKFFERAEARQGELNIPAARERLREIGDEVTDDVASINQYYRSQENRRMAAAADAGIFAAYVVAATAVVALVQFVALALLLQRWLLRPIITLNDAARSISGGDLETRITLKSKDEWGQLSSAINDMTSSLKISQQRLRTHERFAALGEIASYSAHNIRNPLAGIRATAQVLKDDSAAAGSEIREAMDDIIDTIDRLDIWLKRLLEFTRPLELEYSPTDINELAEETIRLAGRPFADRKVRLRKRLQSDLPLILVDPIMIEQALAAVITNAYEAVDEHGSITIETRHENSSEDILIRLTDNGRGVPEHIQSRLFRAFMSSKDGGTGLGLAQARKIIDMHGGQITLESSPGEGTTVSICLPVIREIDSQST
jgi:signal transduction histidine kinase